jgi:hypothetical protein
MKNLKSILAIIMALIIGVCLTGCQTPEEKAESERLVSESVSVSERLVSESVSDSERIVSESVSASESVVASVSESNALALEEKQKEEDNKAFFEYFNIPTINSMYLIMDPTNLYARSTNPFEAKDCYAEGEVLIYGIKYGSEAELRAKHDGIETAFKMVAPKAELTIMPDGSLELSGLRYVFSVDLTAFEPEKLVIPMEYYDNSGNRDPEKDFVLTYYWN